jgi:hypothetical protein
VRRACTSSSTWHPARSSSWRFLPAFWRKVAMAEGERQMLPPKRTLRKLLPRWCMHSSCLSLSVITPVCTRRAAAVLRSVESCNGCRGDPAPQCCAMLQPGGTQDQKARRGRRQRAQLLKCTYQVHYLELTAAVAKRSKAFHVKHLVPCALLQIELFEIVTLFPHLQASAGSRHVRAQLHVNAGARHDAMMCCCNC